MIYDEKKKQKLDFLFLSPPDKQIPGDAPVNIVCDIQL